MAVAFMMDDSQIQAPLAPFMGEVPEASAWFTWALAQVPQRILVNVEGARIETPVWGEAGRPGLLFLHGHGGRSRLLQREDAAHLMAALPGRAPYEKDPEGDHHVMIDQPLAFVAAIEALLATRPATWPLQQEGVPA